MTDNFLIPVTVMMPQSMLARIGAVARRHEAEVGPLIVELVRRQLVVGRAASTDPASSVRTGGESRPSNWRRWDPALDDRIRELHANGLSDNRIGKELGWAPGTIATHRERLGLPRLFTSINPKLQRPDPVTTALATEVDTDAP